MARWARRKEGTGGEMETREKRITKTTDSALSAQDGDCQPSSAAVDGRYCDYGPGGGGVRLLTAAASLPSLGRLGVLLVGLLEGRRAVRSVAVLEPECENRE